MRLVVSVLAAVCLVASAQAASISILDQNKHPSLTRQKMAGNCTTTCTGFGNTRTCNTFCY